MGVYLKMTIFIDVILLIIHIIAVICSVIFLVLGVYDYFADPVDVEKLLKKLHIPFKYNQAFIVGMVSIFLAIVTGIIRLK